MEQSNRQTSKRNRRLKTGLQISFLVLFIGAIGVCYFYIPSSKALGKGAFSEHMWRQADVHAMTYNFFTDSAGFFSPRVFDLGSAKEARAAQEFPLLYYLSAKWDQIRTQYSSSTVNWFHFLFLLFAFVLFYIKSSLRFIKDNVGHLILFSIVYLSIWTGGLWQYYGMNNFPDIAALAATLIGISFFINFRNRPSKSALLWGTLFFLLAGLFKISFLIYPVALWLPYITIPRKDTSKRKSIAALLTICLPALFWVVYIKLYNAHYDSTVFLSSIMPLWEKDSGQISFIWDRLSKEFLPLLTHWSWLITFAFMFFLNLFYLPLRQKWTQLIALLGIILFYLLFYAQLAVHAYYLILLYPLMVLIGYNFTHTTLIKWGNQTVFQISLTILFSFFFILQLRSTKQYLQSNYDEQNIHHTYLEIPPEFLDEELMSNKLEKLSISADSRIISTSDWSFNISLNTCKRYGWTLSWKEFSEPKVIDLHKKGANYLIYWGKHEPLEKQQWKLEVMDRFDSGTSIYRLEY